jgi:hypothetical protein
MKFVSSQKCLELFLLLFTIMSFSACASGQDYSGYDLSTVEGVNVAREAKLGKTLDSQSKGCVRIPEELPGIILLGSFAYDRGCALNGAIINKRGFSTDKDVSKLALESLGWGKAGAEKRKELALKWVQFGLLAFENPLEQATKDFTNQTFETPRAVSSADGSITVSLWVQEPAGMRCQSVYDKLIYRFLKDGILGETTTEKSFRVPCRSSN